MTQRIFTFDDELAAGAKIDLADDVETGFTVCRRDSTGELFSGPVTTGTRASVKIMTKCPEGSTPEAQVHSHLKEIGLGMPSKMDAGLAAHYGIPQCIILHSEDGDRVSCYGMKSWA